MNLNQFIVTGNIGADPELHRKSEESAGVVAFSVAQSVSKLNEATKKFEQTHTNWFPIRAFGSLAERVKTSLKKGDRVIVIGKLKTFQYEDESGATRYGFEILADDVSRSGILPKGANTFLSEPMFLHGNAGGEGS